MRHPINHSTCIYVCLSNTESVGEVKQEHLLVQSSISLVKLVSIAPIKRVTHVIDLFDFHGKCRAKQLGVAGVIVKSSCEMYGRKFANSKCPMFENDGVQASEFSNRGQLRLLYII